MTDEPAARAEAIAETVLFPAALEVDQADTVPASNFDAVAEGGFFGIFAPPELGGLGLDAPQMFGVIEAFAAGCLATTFVWIQHFGLLGSLLGHAGGPLGERWLGPAVRGEVKGGIALGGLQPGPPQLRAERTADGWRIDGTSRWVTGWGIVDLLQVAARIGDDALVTVLIDAVDQPGLTVTPQPLAAVDAARTVRLDFDRLDVPADRVVAEAPYTYEDYLSTDRLRLNGSLALGVARRCCTLIGASGLDAELEARRAALDAAAGEAVFDARAAASAFAVQAAAALAVHQGSGSIVAGEHAPRLMREALFMLVFGTRPGIKAALRDRLGLTS